jgi:hypothetical protein
VPEGIGQDEIVPARVMAKVERGERRIDLIEFVAIARAMDRDPLGLLKQYLEENRGSHHVVPHGEFRSGSGLCSGAKRAKHQKDLLRGEARQLRL